MYNMSSKTCVNANGNESCVSWFKKKKRWRWHFSLIFCHLFFMNFQFSDLTNTFFKNQLYCSTHSVLELPIHRSLVSCTSENGSLVNMSGYPVFSPGEFCLEQPHGSLDFFVMICPIENRDPPQQSLDIHAIAMQLSIVSFLTVVAYASVE